MLCVAHYNSLSIYTFNEHDNNRKISSATITKCTLSSILITIQKINFIIQFGGSDLYLLSHVI
jgi:hypothetical protein